uniref:AP2/ERF domain-containing protein n=1 Tax=Tetradesmus obliquus TaxID=3088 RepID=A0A383VU07_TETOB|eukprot:jgi/Sobl393_1/16000/SZX68373.1
MARCKYKGVGRVKDNPKKTYRAFCDRQHVGYYETADEAAKARDLQVLAVRFLQGREASNLNFSREEYSEDQIGAVVDKLTTPKAPTPTQHSNGNGSRGSRFEARIRVEDARVLLACCKTKEAAARVRDLAKMLLQGAPPEAARGLTLDWAGVSPEQLRRQQAPVRAKLVRKLLDTNTEAAVKLATKLVDDEERLQQQERQQQQQQQQQATQCRQRSASQTASQSQERRRQPQRSSRDQLQADETQRLADAVEQAASSLMEVARCAKRMPRARQADAPAAARRRL